jgi:rare lipoprotein A
MLRVWAALTVLLALASLPAHAGEAVVQAGEASYYADRFQGERTASGEAFDQRKRTAASPDLPLGTRATVTHRETGRSVEVEINDRGPRHGGRVIDLSKSAARALGIAEEGTAPVTVEARPEAQPTPALQEKIGRRARSGR